jgi:hypothetical protein
MPITVGIAVEAADLAQFTRDMCSEYQLALRSGDRAGMTDALTALDVADEHMDDLRRAL